MEVHWEYDNREGIGLITFGYSKDYRPDLKQFMIYLMSSQDGDVPFLAKTVAGNTSGVIPRTVKGKDKFKMESMSILWQIVRYTLEKRGSFVINEMDHTCS